MHELAIADGILDLVKEHVPAADAHRVRAVRVRVGELAGIVTASLVFSFDALVSGTPFEGARLEVVPVPARGRCADCGSPFGLSKPRFVCPSCGGSHIAMTSGRELQVIEVELESHEEHERDHADVHVEGHDGSGDGPLDGSTDGHGGGPADGHGNGYTRDDGNGSHGRGGAR